MEHKITQEQHERLCAYLFDELQGAERATFEAELAADPALQAERAKLEASLSLVREFAPAPAELSSANRAVLTAAAVAGGDSGGDSGGGSVPPGTPLTTAPIPRLAWYRHPGLQVLAATALAVVAFRALDQRVLDDSMNGLRPSNSQNVARAKRSADNRDAYGLAGKDSGLLADEADFKGLHELGYLDSVGYAEEQEEQAGATGSTSGASLDLGLASAKPQSPETRSIMTVTATPDPAHGAGLPTGGLRLDAAGVTGQPIGEPVLRDASVLEVGRAAQRGALAPTKEAFLGYLSTPGGSAPVDLPSLGASLEALPAGGGGLTGAVVNNPAPPAEKLKVAARPALGSAAAGEGTDKYFFERGQDGDFDASTRGTIFEALEALESVDELESEIEMLERSKLESDLSGLGYSGGSGGGSFTQEDEQKLGELRQRLSGVESGTRRKLVEVDPEAEKARKQARAEEVYRALVKRTERLPNEKPSMMYFRYWGDNGFEFPQNDPLSTFGADVDTASYTLARRYIQDGYLPERAQIRTEEFVNYMTPDIAPPTDGSVFRIEHELAPSLFGPGGEAASDRWTLRVGVRGEVIAKEERAPLALTFVIDVSGSMEDGGRLELVKHALRLLTAELNAGDSIAIVTFNNDARRVLQMQTAERTSAIERALFEMSPGGGTNAEAGLRLGYEEAVLGFTEGAVNRVVFLSDGVGNIGETSEKQLLADVKRAREKGIYLNTIGVGMGNHNDQFLEQLANGGDGLCNYIDGPDEAQRALVDNFTGAFEPIARDVKLQVDFDPSQVLAYRLLGYENRAIADVDFRNDKVDAGELGSGHQVVALYELVLGEVDASGERPLATTRLRYKLPYLKLEKGQADTATEIEAPCSWSQANGTFAGSTVGFQKSALAAEFAEMLRRSSHARDDSVSLLRYKLEELAKTTGDDEVTELATLVQLAQPQLEAALLQRDPVTKCADDLARFEYDCTRRIYLGATLQTEWIEQRRGELRGALEVALME